MKAKGGGAKTFAQMSGIYFNGRSFPWIFIDCWPNSAI